MEELQMPELTKNQNTKLPPLTAKLPPLPPKLPPLKATLPPLKATVKKEVRINDEPKIICPPTEDRYALYLRGSIGNAYCIEPLSPLQKIEDYDEWIQIWGFIKVRSVALAQKGHDLHLTIAEYWTAAFAFFFFGSLLIVSFPSQECYPWLRSISYIVGINFYCTILLWKLMNLRFEQQGKLWVTLLRLPAVFVSAIQIWVVFAYCRNFNSYIITCIMFSMYCFFGIYIVLMLIKDCRFEERLREALLLSFNVMNSFMSIMFGYGLIMNGQLVLGGCVLVNGIFAVILVFFEAILKFRKGMVTMMSIDIVNELVLLTAILIDIGIYGEKHEQEFLMFGILVTFLGTINILILVNRVCKVSTELLVEKLHRNQSLDDEF